MKKIAVIMLMLCWKLSSSAQVTTDPNTGNVGIGITPSTSRLTISTEGSNITDGAFFLVNNTNSTFGGGATIAGIKSLGTDGQYNFLKIQNRWGTKFLINGDGNVGIGTDVPGAKLDIDGGVYAETGESYFATGTYVDPFPMVRFGIKVGSNGIAVNGDSVFNTGLSIGTTNLNGYLLAVKGNVHAQQVVVELSNFPDYVFRSDYKIRPLSEVQTYIDQNHHLPDMPSAAEVEKDGLNLGEMNKILTKKVEELTLYLIEQSKRLDQQSREIELLKAKIKTNN